VLQLFIHKPGHDLPIRHLLMNHSIIFLLFQLLCIPQFYAHDRPVISTKKDRGATQLGPNRGGNCKAGIWIWSSDPKADRTQNADQGLSGGTRRRPAQLNRWPVCWGGIWCQKVTRARQSRAMLGWSYETEKVDKQEGDQAATVSIWSSRTEHAGNHLLPMLPVFHHGPPSPSAV